MVADPPLHDLEGGIDRRSLHAHGVGAAGPGLCHPGAARIGAGVCRNYGIGGKVHIPDTESFFRERILTASARRWRFERRAKCLRYRRIDGSTIIPGTHSKAAGGGTR